MTHASPTVAPPLEIRWLGRRPYEEVWATQHSLVAAIAAGDAPDTLLLVEHPPVITLGRRRGAALNVIDAGGVPVIAVERGGDATYHGPGQLVAYPLLRLVEGDRDLHLHLRRLEGVVIDLLAGYGLEAGRREGQTGVWVQDRKLASVGVAVRRWVTYHGVALNVSTHLAPFAGLHPCGLPWTVMAAMQDLMAGPPHQWPRPPPTSALGFLWHSEGPPLTDLPGIDPDRNPGQAGAGRSPAAAHAWADALHAAAEARDEDRFLTVVQLILQEPDDAVVRLLAPYMGRPGGIGRTAAHGLLMLGMTSLETLVAALDAGDPRARVHAAWALGSLRHPDASHALLRLLENPDSEAALADAALDSLAEIADKGSVKRLVALLADPAQAARRPRICRALGFIGDVTAIPKVAPLLANPKLEVRLRAAEALVRLIDRRGWPVLFEVLRGQEVPGDDAAAALRALGDLSSAAPLLLGEGDNGYHLRRDAAEVLGTLGDVRAVGPLATALADPNPWVRGAAVYSLGDWAIAAWVGRMARMLDDSSDWVKISAARGLGLLGDPTARKALDKALLSPNREVATAIQDALDALAE